MDKEVRVEIIEHLRGLASGKIKPNTQYIGLCGELSWRFNLSYYRIKTLLDGYPNSSGDPLHPIRSFNKKYDAHQYYNKYNNKWRGKQGAERRKLCSWLADKLENMYE